MSMENILGEITQIIDKNRYKATFNLPILGDRNWIVESNQKLDIGDKVVVDIVYGQLLKVKKIS